MRQQRSNSSQYKWCHSQTCLSRLLIFFCLAFEREQKGDKWSCCEIIFLLKSSSSLPHFIGKYTTLYESKIIKLWKKWRLTVDVGLKVIKLNAIFMKRSSNWKSEKNKTKAGFTQTSYMVECLMHVSSKELFMELHLGNLFLI